MRADIFVHVTDFDSNASTKYLGGICEKLPNTTTSRMQKPLHNQRLKPGLTLTRPELENISTALTK